MAAANVAALELVLDDFADQFRFDADAVRAMVGLPRFTWGNIEPNASVRELVNQLMLHLIADLQN